MFNNFLEVETYFKKRKSLGVKPGLDRIKTLLQLLDHPEKKVKGIHVAGTNGKGSTIHYIKNALIQNNFKVGVFVSPSTNGLTNHMFINNEPIDDQHFVKLLNAMYPVISMMDRKNEHPTEFEIITVLAFLYFAESVDFALIETGMGGKEDTTNCFLPLLSIITNVSRDHMTFLGNSVEEIAIHKAGIMKYRTPAIIGPMEKEAMLVIEQVAEANKVDLSRFGQEFKIIESEHSHFRLENRLYNNLNITLQMVGKHQQVNASLAIMALVKLIQMGTRIDINLAVKGIESTNVPGRFELIYHSPRIIVDGAHNEAGIEAFINAAKTVGNPHEKHVIFAAFKDKDIQKMVKPLQAYFDRITLTTFDHPRAATALELTDYITPCSAVWVEDWKRLIDTTIQSSKPETDFYITGSLDFISKVRNYIAKS